MRSAGAAELELLTPGVLTSATEGTYPPFSMQGADGELDGLEMRIMGEICRRLELEYKPVIVKWDSMLVGLQANHFDIVGNAMGITAKRQEAVTFCDGWLETGARVVVREDSAYQSSDEMKGKAIGAIAASTFIPIIENLGGEVKAYKADVDAMQDLVNGNLEAVILEDIAANHAITRSKLPLRSLPGLIDPIQLGWAVKKGKPNLVRAIKRDPCGHGRGVVRSSGCSPTSSASTRLPRIRFAACSSMAGDGGHRRASARRCLNGADGAGAASAAGNNCTNPMTRVTMGAFARHDSVRRGKAHRHSAGRAVMRGAAESVTATATVHRWLWTTMRQVGDDDDRQLRRSDYRHRHHRLRHCLRAGEGREEGRLRRQERGGRMRLRRAIPARLSAPTIRR